MREAHSHEKPVIHFRSYGGVLGALRPRLARNRLCVGQGRQDLEA